MIYGPLGGSMVEFEYNARNQLIRAGNTFYEYDALGNRTAIIEDGVRTDFVTCNLLPLCRILTATTGEDTTYFVWGFGLISQERDDEWLFFHFNNIGSTQALTNLAGEVVARFEYCPYGRLTSANEHGILFLYNGMFGIVTDSNELLHMRARYYNPEIMRFLNPDPIKDGLNWYAYVNGNPISYFDPFGLFAMCWLGANWSTISWVANLAMFAVGAALIVTGVGVGLGVPLIVAGATGLAGDIMHAVGVEHRVALQILAAIDIVAGVALLFTPFAAVGASMVGSGVGSLAGGHIAEALGYSYEMGAFVGNIGGSFAGGRVYKLYDTYRINQIARQGTVVIGETMTRVTPEAQRLGAGHFNPSNQANFVYNSVSKKLGNALTMSENTTWIRRVAQSGVGVVDVGIDVTRSTRSSFYIMEQQKLFEYLLLG
jgi:RHS repeat-associated protein